MYVANYIDKCRGKAEGFSAPNDNGAQGFEAELAWVDQNLWRDIPPSSGRDANKEFQYAKGQVTMPRFIRLIFTLGLMLSVYFLWKDNGVKSAEISRLNGLLAKKIPIANPIAPVVNPQSKVPGKKEEVDHLVEKIQRAKARAASDDVDFFEKEVHKAHESLDRLNEELLSVKEEERDEGTTTNAQKSGLNVQRKRVALFWDEKIHAAAQLVQTNEVALREARRQRMAVSEKQTTLEQSKADLKAIRDQKRQALLQIETTATEVSVEGTKSDRSLKRAQADIEADLKRERDSLKETEAKKKNALQSREAAVNEARQLEAEYQKAMNELNHLRSSSH